MNINDFTIGQIKEISNYLPQCNTSAQPESIWTIGEKYLIRTVTMIITGKLQKLGKTELLLSDAAWVADTGRFYNNLKSCEFEEVEPFINDVIVGRGSIIDATIITARFRFPAVSDIAPKRGPDTAINRFEPAINSETTTNVFTRVHPSSTPNSIAKGVKARLMTVCEKKLSAASYTYQRIRFPRLVSFASNANSCSSDFSKVNF